MDTAQTIMATFVQKSCFVFSDLLIYRRDLFGNISAPKTHTYTRMGYDRARDVLDINIYGEGRTDCGMYIDETRDDGKS